MKTDRRTLLFGTPALALGMAGAPTAKSSAKAQGSPSPNGLPEGATSRFAQINGIRMHLVEMGQGPVLILLHGWPQTWFAWRGVMPRLAARFRVVAPDLRGTGLSERTPSGYDKRTIAEDIHALISALGVGQAHLAAHDMGGKGPIFWRIFIPKSFRNWRSSIASCRERRIWTRCRRRMALRFPHGSGNAGDAHQRT